MEKKSRIIADSSGLISLLIGSDQNHLKAAHIAERLRDEPTSIHVPSEVLAEAINILGKKFGHQFAAESVENLFESTGFVVVASSDIARRDALAMFKGMTASVSYIDCLVMVMAEQYGTVEIFGFDDIFRQRGYFLPAARRRAA
jgi:predicted nucleic acid-binding protein